MWIMTPFGILMPSAIPADIDAGEFDLQVRARDRAALKKLIKRYMDRAPVSAVLYMPNTDYEYRFHCRKIDFEAAVSEMVREIDYVKFKPQTNRPGNGGDDLHHLYNTLWYMIAKHYDSTIIGGDGPKGEKRRSAKKGRKTHA